VDGVALLSSSCPLRRFARISENFLPDDGLRGFVEAECRAVCNSSYSGQSVSFTNDRGIKTVSPSLLCRAAYPPFVDWAEGWLAAKARVSGRSKNALTIARTSSSVRAFSAPSLSRAPNV
jgi:hypothetical protein